MEKRKALCGVCPGGCAVEVELEGEKLVDIHALQDVPFGALCARGKGATEVIYSPDRLKKPLLRVGERGEGKFREASWDEALDFVATKMQGLKKEYGAECMMSHSGRGAFEDSISEFFNGKDSVSSNFLYPFGSPNAASDGSLCYVSYGILAPITTYGLEAKRLVSDLLNSKLIVFWGSNPATDSPPFLFKTLLKAKEKGIRIIAIDHMKSDIANRADEWVAIRSGTDGALALGLINVIIQENLYDAEFVANYTTGFPELKEYVQDFTPEKVEELTWVPKETVVALAREIAQVKNATLRTYTGLEYTNSGVQNIRAVFILWALTGNLDVPGGLCINPAPKRKSVGSRIPLPKTDKRMIGAAEYPLHNQLTEAAHFMEFPKAVLEGKPYPIKGLLINGASTLTSYPQPKIFEEAYKKLELLVVIDRFMTRDALYADVVLPATTHFEIQAFQRYPGYVRLRKKVLEPIGEARNDILILADLANRLGYGHLYPQNEEEIIEWAFADSPGVLEELKASEDGIALPVPERIYKKYETGQLREDGKPGFPTPSGKLEIWSSLLKEHGYEPLPKYIAPSEGPGQDPELDKTYPLILNTGARIQSTFRSQHLNIPSLLKMQDKPLILINPQDAEQRGIQHGDKVLVQTKRGMVTYYADVSCKVLPGTIEANVGGGTPIQKEEWKNCNANHLTDFYNRDYISGFPIFKALLCEVKKA